MYSSRNLHFERKSSLQHYSLNTNGQSGKFIYRVSIPYMVVISLCRQQIGRVCRMVKIFSHLENIFLSTLTVRQHLPWPLRVYESSDCVIELCMAYRVDLEYHTKSEVNYMALLHWYGSDGSHYKLDLRKLIRKEYRKVK